MKRYLFASFAACGLLCAFSSSVQAKNVYVPYLGIDYNYSTANLKYLRPNLSSASFVIGSDYNRFFSTEVFYQYSDKDGKNYSNGSSVQTSFQAGGLDMYGYLPLLCGRDLALLGTAGVGIYDFKKSYSNPFIKSGHDQGYGYRAGAGIFYSINEDVALRAVARYIKLDQIRDIDHMVEYSAGIRYTF